MEGVLRQALVTVLGPHVQMVGAGRTDAGVHALGQVVSVKSDRLLAPDNLEKGLNSLLPSSVQVLGVQMMDDVFDARRSARAREYHYLFSSQTVPFYLLDFVTKVKFLVSEDLFSPLGAFLTGKKDFKNFCSVGSNQASSVREIYEFGIYRKPLQSLYQEEFGPIYVLRVVANSFLYRMVRSLVGAIFEVFKGNRTIDDLKALFGDGSRAWYRYTVAPPKGLCLVRVHY